GSLRSSATRGVLALLAALQLVLTPEGLCRRAALAAPRAIGLALPGYEKPPATSPARLAARGRSRTCANAPWILEEGPHQSGHIGTLHGRRLQRHPGRSPRCHGEVDVVAADMDLAITNQAGHDGGEPLLKLPRLPLRGERLGLGSLAEGQQPAGEF